MPKMKTSVARLSASRRLLVASKHKHAFKSHILTKMTTQA